MPEHTNHYIGKVYIVFSKQRFQMTSVIFDTWNRKSNTV